MAGPISHTSIQYMDFVEIFSVALDLSAIYFSVELPLCLVTLLLYLRMPYPVFWSQVEYKIVLFY